MKRYGQLVKERATLTDETIEKITYGVIKREGKWFCVQCETVQNHHFYQYHSAFFKEPITYCRHCITMGRMDSVHKVVLTQTYHQRSAGNYALSFELSPQQQFASSQIVIALHEKNSLLLHAVTGAGKTEMMFEAISVARQKGFNVAVVSPRVDVVIEVSQRICQTFKHENIDVLHQASQQKFQGHFIIATVHQLYRFKNHFDVIFIDEVDAFPLSMDPNLMHCISSAARSEKTLIYMTATPPKRLLKSFSPEHIITLPARFHRYPLVVPKFKYFKVKFRRRQSYLMKHLKQQVQSQRTTLLFFSNIEEMKDFYKTYQSLLNSLCYVYSEDPERLSKVQALRDGHYKIVLTTTILERGFTMPYLDVWIMDSHKYTASALIQIAGRVGRKKVCPDGTVLFYHTGRTIAMYAARHEIKRMNELGREKGWIKH